MVINTKLFGHFNVIFSNSRVIKSLIEWWNSYRFWQKRCHFGRTRRRCSLRSRKWSDISENTARRVGSVPNLTHATLPYYPCPRHHLLRAKTDTEPRDELWDGSVIHNMLTAYRTKLPTIPSSRSVVSEWLPKRLRSHPSHQQIRPDLRHCPWIRAAIPIPSAHLPDCLQTRNMVKINCEWPLKICYLGRRSESFSCNIRGPANRPDLRWIRQCVHWTLWGQRPDDTYRTHRPTQAQRSWPIMEGTRGQGWRGWPSAVFIDPLTNPILCWSASSSISSKWCNAFSHFLQFCLSVGEWLISAWVLTINDLTITELAVEHRTKRFGHQIKLMSEILFTQPLIDDYIRLIEPTVNFSIAYRHLIVRLNDSERRMSYEIPINC